MDAPRKRPPALERGGECQCELVERIARLIDPEAWEYADKIRAELPDSANYLVDNSRTTARRVIHELGLSEQRYPLGILIFGCIDSQEDA